MHVVLSLNESILSSFCTMSWFNCATFACMAHYITLLFTLNNSFVVRSCKNLVTLLINFLCYVVFCCATIRGMGPRISVDIRGIDPGYSSNDILGQCHGYMLCIPWHVANDDMSINHGQQSNHLGL